VSDDDKDSNISTGLGIGDKYMENYMKNIVHCNCHYCGYNGTVMKKEKEKPKCPKCGNEFRCIM